MESESAISRRDILWRDFVFLILGGISLRIISFVETHAASNDRSLPPFSYVTATNTTQNTQFQIVDAGFCLTAPLYIFLRDNPHIHNCLAFLNTLILLIPAFYTTHVTVWQGDYTLSFRLLTTQLFRSFCGWFTYLPPDPHFLMSHLDFPEIAQCLFEDCAGAITQRPGEALPFVTFFSGHVATLVIVANHMYTRKRVRGAVVLHVLNILQIVRLLATRGHYSIDIIIGWCVAIWFSNPGEKLGLSYSRGQFGEFWTNSIKRDVVLEYFLSQGQSMLAPGDPSEVEMYQSETTAKIAAAMAKDFALRNLEELRKEVETKGIYIREIQSLRRKDLIRLLSWAQLSLEELRAEARLLDVKLPMEGMEFREIIGVMWQTAKNALRERGDKLFHWLEEEGNGNTNGEVKALVNGHLKQL